MVKKEMKGKSVNKKTGQKKNRPSFSCVWTSPVLVLTCLIGLFSIWFQFCVHGGKCWSRDILKTNTTLPLDKKQSWSSWVGYTFHRSLEELKWRLPRNIPRRSDGYFPESCIWRVVPDMAIPASVKDRSHTWRVREYQFWDENSQVWKDELPVECTIVSRGRLLTDTDISSPRKTIDKDYEDYRVLKNVWYSQGVFYKVTDDTETKEAKSLSSNIDLATLVVRDVGAFASATKVRVVEGETVMLDFSYFIHPTAIGHWLEYLLPMMSMRRIEGFANVPDTILMMHLKRSFVFEWVRAAFGAAFGITRKGNLPPIIFQEETNAVWSQIGMKFESLPRDEWVCFDTIIVAKDMIDGGPRTAFNDSNDASIFRKRMHRMYEIKTRPISLKSDGDRKITLLHKAANRRIQNRDQLKALLSKFGVVSEFEFTDQIPMKTQMKIISETHVLVSAHTSGLANAMFLPPGALVLELRHRNFMSILEKTFEQQIYSLGDVSHTYWKATKQEEGPYIYEDDERKFGGELWAGTKCNTEDCVEAHTLVDLVVNVTEIEILLQKHLHRNKSCNK